ncbi:MAG TPA: radical SAM protein [Methanomicrobia archaeon]|nr:radical SAM protein [Methanomicrobia archaeon]HEX59329.1 radical SAM protein [Methanomicrobia archaeon]
MSTEIIKRTLSLCPTCLSVVSAELYESDNIIYIRKKCEEHGEFEDIYWADAELYKLFETRDAILGLQHPRAATGSGGRGCPFDCGLCSRHESATVLAIIDVTERCNLGCPTCFAAAGGGKDPDIEEIKATIDGLSRLRPKPAGIQFSGGEPTLRDDLVELVAYAKRRFKHVEVNTNGLRLAESSEYCRELEAAGLSVFYLQFDGIGSEPYRALRGKDLWEIKKRAIENHRHAGERPAIVLVPTVVRGVNDHQIGEIIRFAAANADVVRGVNFQPVSLCGRNPFDIRRRITIPDVLRAAERQTSFLRADDFFPASVMSIFVTQWGGPPVSCHFCCGAVTYLVVDSGGGGRGRDGKKPVPITRFLSVERLAKAYARRLRRGRELSTLDILRSVRLRLLLSPGLMFSALKLTSEKYEDVSDLHFKLLLVGAMHFMDAFNFDLERVRRCVIHYGLPDGRVVPFCAYNNIHRWSR